MTDILPLGGDAYAELSALTDAATGALVSDATVTVTLYKKDGVPTPVTGAIDLPATPVVGTPGKYRAIIPKTAAVERGKTYRCEAKAVKGGLTMPFSQEVIVQRFGA